MTKTRLIKGDKGEYLLVMKEKDKNLVYLTFSKLYPGELEDLEIMWEVKEATADLDNIADNFKLGNCRYTFISGSCYYDYDDDGEEEFGIEKYQKGNRRLHLSVTKGFELKYKKGVNA